MIHSLDVVTVQNANSNDDTTRGQGYNCHQGFLAVVNLVPMNPAGIGLNDNIVGIHWKRNSIKKLKDEPPANDITKVLLMPM